MSYHSNSAYMYSSNAASYGGFSYENRNSNNLVVAEEHAFLMANVLVEKEVLLKSLQ